MFLPKEHGSWSLALEPLALGMLLAPSLPAVALVIICLSGFFSRRPYKSAFALEHSIARRAAREALVMFTALAVGGGFFLLVLADATSLWPLGFAIPFAALFAYFDAQGEGRAAAAELAGSAAFAVLPMTFAILAGWSVSAALGLAALSLVRNVPTVLTLRTFLRQRKGERLNALVPFVAASLGAMLVATFAARGQIPWPAVGGALLLLGRTIWLTGPWRPAWSARRAGIAEAALGVAYLIVVASAYFRAMQPPQF